MEVHRTSTRGLVFECEGSSWGLKLDISVRDVQGNVLAKQTRIQEGPDGLHTAVVKVAQDKQTEAVTLVCRAEIPEVKLVKEIKIWITDDFRPAASPEGSLVYLVVLIVLGSLGLCVSICLWIFWIKDMHKVLEPGKLTEYTDLSDMKTTGAIITTGNGSLIGVELSRSLAKQDLEEMSKYKNYIIDVGRELHFHPALIAAIISKQSRAGTELEPNGFGRHDPNSFGLMQINKYFHVLKGKPFSRVHIDSGTTFLIHLIKSMTQREQLWTSEQQLKGALFAYIRGIENIPKDATGDMDLDALTPTKDFANDVIARAQFFANQEYQV
uniref:Uncharacterized protein n=1 Tax=Iconisemion striatum TaxID=60296 RepID=A0A1A7YGK4_9TELE